MKVTRFKVRNFIIYAIVIALVTSLYFLQFHPRFQRKSFVYSEQLPASDTPLMFNPEHQLYRLLDIINDYRRDNGLGELEFSDELNEVALVRAEECENYWSHTRPNGQLGIDLLPKDKWRGENLAKNFDDADDVLQAWIESPAHNDNLLFGEFTKCGIAYHQCGNSENFWCIIFTD